MVIHMLLGVDIGGTKCALILADNQGNIQKRICIATANVKDTLDWICSGAKTFAQETNLDAVGISCGGPLDSNKGEICSPPNLPGWDRVPIIKLLEQATGAPAYLCNDANACALAEWKYGAGQGCSNMVFLTFGTGLGAGIILNGELYEGTNGMAGEVGHIRLAEFGPVGYGKAGSFEGFCSGGGIARLGKEIVQEAWNQDVFIPWCPNEVALDILNTKMIADAAKAGDSHAVGIFQEAGRKLGYGLSILMDILNPECIVIGSVFARAENLLRDEMEYVIQREALQETASVCRVVPASLGDQIGDYAAVAVAQRGWEKDYVS